MKNEQELYWEFCAFSYASLFLLFTIYAFVYNFRHNREAEQKWKRLVNVRNLLDAQKMAKIAEKKCKLAHCMQVELVMLK